VTVAAVVVLLAGLLAWLGQTLAAVAPAKAAALGLTEAPGAVDPVFLADMRAEAVWDTLSLWTLPTAAVLLLLGEPAWAGFGLVGGGSYVYFAGRGIAQRLVMRRRAVRIGTPGVVGTALTALAFWGLAGAATIAMAALELAGRG
jgi:hypothetical protein